MLRARGRTQRATRKAGAYVSSQIYGGNEPDLAMEGTGISLATAMSISGAAASPNMGYHSSPATAFLMTLFNVRLGAWMPNPGRCDDAQAGHRPLRARQFAARAAARARRDDRRSRARHLSFRRRPFRKSRPLRDDPAALPLYRVSDAGADPIARSKPRQRGPQDQDRPRHRYQLRRIAHLEPRRGRSIRNMPGRSARSSIPRARGSLLYIKPSLSAICRSTFTPMPRQRPFPHETTADQFFSELQFESYRRLGDFFTDELAKKTDEQGNRTDRFADVPDSSTRSRPSIARKRKATRKSRREAC